MGKRAWMCLLSCAFVFVLSLFAACGNNPDSIVSDDAQTENGDDSGDSGDVNDEDFKDKVANALAENSGDHEAADDYSWDVSTVIPIVLNGNSIAVTGAGATVDGGRVTITSAGTYSISGSLTDGQIIVNTEDEEVVRLILNGIDIRNATSAPLYVMDSEKTVIVLAENTENLVTDGNSYVFASADENEPNAAIFSKSDLTFYGNGSLTVDGNYNDGISSKDGLIIKSGTITVTSADDGIRGKDYLIIKNGHVAVNAVGDGLKSDNDEDATRGYVFVEGGEMDITSGGDAITGQTDVLIADGEISISSGGGSNRTVSGDASAKGVKAVVNVIIDDGTFTVNSADDALHTNGNLVINGGAFVISTGDDGIHADSALEINGGDIRITKSYEAIESATITINNGNIRLVATDDGFNATNGTRTEANDGSFLHLNGGTISVNASVGDGLDGNGNIVMTGGTVIVHGPASDPEVGMDYNGTCKISGGTLVMSGTNSNMTQAPSTSSTQYSVLVRFSARQSANSIFHIQDSNGNDVLTFAPVRAYQSIILSSSSLAKGSTYTVYTGGSSTGTVTDGLYAGGTYSGGTKYTSFTISSMITTLGSNSGGPGGRP